MPNIRSFPNNQSSYVGAEWIMRWLHGRTSGVFGAAGNAAVSVVPSSMQLQVSDGIGWLSNADGNGIVWWIDDYQSNGSNLTLTVDTASATYDRIDRVVVEWETTNYVALPTVKLLKGAPAASPAAPALTNDTLKRQISLARISIPAGATTLSAANLTDERLNSSVCGLVTESVSVDTSMIQSQFDALLAAIEAELVNVTGGSEYDLKPIRSTNISVAAASFVSYTPGNAEETALYNLGYEKRAAVSITGALSTMTPYLTLSLGSVDAANVSIANQFATYDGGVYIYADDTPSSAITILTAALRKAVV